MPRISLSIITVIIIVLTTMAMFAHSSDEITSLPGLNFVPAFKQYAGYLTIDAVKGKNIFYWFVESARDPENDPVFLWTNGGPGCSGLLGFFTEQGPFAPGPDGLTLQANPYAWNNIANIFFIEAPVGVGFSYSNDPNDYNTGDSQTALDNYQAILAFFAKYPQFADNDFYISSESYGGHYIPTLAHVIVEENKQGGNPQVNFKGFAVGNPFTDPIENLVYGSMQTFFGHSLISKPTWDSIQYYCIEKNDTDQCNQWANQGSAEVGVLNLYGLDYDLCPLSGKAAQTHRLLEYLKSPLLKLLPNKNHHDNNNNHNKNGDSTRTKMAIQNRKNHIRTPYDPCREAYTTTYLNRPEVIAAIHANPNLGRPWEECSSVLNYNQSDSNVYMEPYYLNLIANGTLRMMVYSGDDDSVCAATGTQYWLYNLGLKQKQSWTPWYFNGQLSGYFVKFEGLSYVTVHSAGHEVPEYEPARAFELFNGFLNGTWF